MLNRIPNTRRLTAPQPGAGEEGYMLIGVLVLVAILLITLAVAAPRVASELQRDKEDELMHRGLQYQQAIRLYYKKFGRYPASLDQLEKTNEIRFLRKRYKDPVTGKDEWRLIHLGEAKVKPTGFFGQPLQGLAGIGAASGNGTGIAGAGNAGNGGTGTGSSSAFGSGSGSSAFGSSSNSGSSAFGSGSSGSAFGSGSSSSAFGSGSSSSAFGSGSGSGDGQTTTGGVAATGSSGPGTSSPTIGTPGFGTPAGTQTTSAFGGGDQTFGGGGIVGISSTSPKASIREYRKQKHYNEWEFVYYPQQDQQGAALQGAGAGNGTPNGITGSGTTGSGSSAFGSTNTTGTSSSPGFGMGSGTGTSPTPATPTP